MLGGWSSWCWRWLGGSPRPGARADAPDDGVGQRHHRRRLALDHRPHARGRHHARPRSRPARSTARTGCASRCPTTTSSRGTTRFPVLYLLHGGAGGNSAQWTTGGGAVEAHHRQPAAHHRHARRRQGRLVHELGRPVARRAGLARLPRRPAHPVDRRQPAHDRRPRAAAPSPACRWAASAPSATPRTGPTCSPTSRSFSGAVDLGDSGTRVGDRRAGGPERLLARTRPFGNPFSPFDTTWNALNPVNRAAPPAGRRRSASTSGSGIHDGDVLEGTMANSAAALPQRAERRRRAALLLELRPARAVVAVRLRRRPQLRLLELRAQRRAAAHARRAAGAHAVATCGSMAAVALSYWHDSLDAGRRARAPPAAAGRHATPTSPSSAPGSPACGPRTTCCAPTRRCGSSCSSGRRPASAPRAATAAGASATRPRRCGALERGRRARCGGAR